MLVCVAAGAEAGAVTVCVRAGTVWAGAVTVVVCAGLGDSTVTPRLFVVELVCWLTVVDGDVDLLFDASTAATMPSTTITAMTGQIHRS